MFIVQSTDVLDLFLNFTAVQFVSELDNVGYYIANKGYMMSRELQRLTEAMTDVKMCQKERLDEDGEIMRKLLRKRRILQRLVFYGTSLLLITSWAYVKALQIHGCVVCRDSFF